MRRTTALSALLAAAVLVPAAPAAAKELTTLSACGADGCVSRTAMLRGVDRGHAGLLDLGMAMADPGRAPFVRLKLGIGDGHGRVFGSNVMAFLPRSGLVRADDGVWYRPSPASLRLFRRAAHGVTRLPASELRPVATQAQAPETATPAAATSVAPVPRHATAAAGGDGTSAGVIAALASLVLVLGACGLAALRHRQASAEGRPAAE